MEKKSIRFYMEIAAAVLALIGIFFYRTASVSSSQIMILTAVGAVPAVLMLILVLAKVKTGIVNLSATVAAVILAWTLIKSFTNQLDPLGWWIAGLYSLEQVKGFIIYAVLVAIALILNVIATFMDVRK